MTATVCPTPGCPNLEPCPAHPYTTWRDDRNGWAWQRLRRRILDRDHHRCRCGARATRVHHVIARNEGGTNDPGNLRSLCDACHDRAHPKRYPF
jgi:5-methylcytosine-specific restriction protein A